MNSNDKNAKDIGDVRPNSLRHVIGQSQVVESVSTTIDYCFRENVPFPHTLLLGPAGTGKTQIAKIVAEELACNLHELLASAIKTSSEFYAVLMKAKDNDIVFLDEIDCLDKSLQTALLVATDEGKIYLPNATGGAPHAINLAKFSLLGCTTEEYGILRPLSDRFRLVLRFQFYEVPDLAEIVRQRSTALGWSANEDVLEPIAQRSKGTPRLALRLLQSCWRICRAQDEASITLAHLERACSLESIDALGLDFNEQRLLSLLGQGAARLNVLASMMGLPTRTVSNVTETFPLRCGLITKDKNGLRHLTEKGRSHLASSNTVTV